MVICIYCKEETKTKMDGLLRKSHYRDYSELVAVAVDNLWMLEKEVAEKGALVIGDGPAPSVASAGSRPVEKAKPLNPGKAAPASAFQHKAPKRAPSPTIFCPVRIPELFLSDGLDGLSATTVEIPFAGESKEAFTLDSWLFGQYNKLLPIKANCRALLRIVHENPKGFLLEDAAPRIGEAAGLLGDYLANHDRRCQIARDDSLATAFPRSGPDADKSRTRYANQFVGSVNSQGVLSGLLSDYRLVALAPESGTRLMPTEPALQFARLTNPVFDGCQTHPTQKFSTEEAAFLLDHIRTYVPVEAFAFRTLIQTIAGGADTPDKLDDALRVYIPAETNRSLSPSFLTSQRSGALSRMADVGLITRKRKGVKVSYIVTEQGHCFIESQASIYQGEPR